MSVKVMSALWELDLPPTEKLVLLALADCANDEGLCWPSIATIARKSGVSERSVQRAIRLGERAKIITRNEVIGKGCKYTLDPRLYVTPDTVSPPTQRHPTPDTVSPKPSRTIKNSISKAREGNPFPRPEWADTQVWADFLENRKAKRLRNTATAYGKFLADLARWQDSEWPPPRLLEYAAAKGWGGIYNPREDRDYGRPDNRTPGQLQRTRPSPALELVKRGRLREAEEAGFGEDGAADWGAGSSLPTFGTG